MGIYYLLLEGKPSTDNEEREEAAGAYINCWIKASDEAAAKDRAVEYIADEGWEIASIEEISIAERAWYADLPDSLECYEQAVRCGFGAIFHIWPIGGDDAVE